MSLLIGQTFSFQTDRRTLRNSRITEMAHSGLRVFVKFTGHQIIIINNNAFDWTNVQVAVHTGPILHGISAGSSSGSYSTHALPRIKARSVYTISPPRPAESTRSELEELGTLPFSLEIRCDTPQGRDFWAGR
jgi:hypothetical protein